jgi:hypothetical protein
MVVSSLNYCSRSGDGGDVKKHKTELAVLEEGVANGGG